jgi:predicted phage-related endonuclease
MLDASHITIHRDLEQGSDAWLQARRGVLTASEMDRVLTPTLKAANNDKSRAHVWEIAAQRITGRVEPTYLSDAMMRGHEEEQRAREIYDLLIAPTETVGFVTNARHGFILGASPDWLVGAEGGCEVKSRSQRFQVQTTVENAAQGTIPTDYMLQVQTQLLVTERSWWDFISFSNGMHMTVTRVYPDAEIHAAIIEAAQKFEASVAAAIEAYTAHVATSDRVFPTEWKERLEVL